MMPAPQLASACLQAILNLDKLFLDRTRNFFRQLKKDVLLTNLCLRLYFSQKHLVLNLPRICCSFNNDLEQSTNYIPIIGGDEQ